ncbi:hypothetical protein Tco_1552484, partial [Tanacetum coccineum]
MVDLYKIFDTLLLLELRSSWTGTLAAAFGVCGHTSSSTPSLWNTYPSLLLLSPCLRLGDADLSRCILEKTLVGSGLLDMLRERLGFSLLLRSPLLFGVLDSEYCDLLLETADDNAYHSIPEGLRGTQVYLDFLGLLLLSSHCVSHGGRGWGEIELRWSTH